VREKADTSGTGDVDIGCPLTFLKRPQKLFERGPGF